MIREAGFDGIDWNIDHGWDSAAVKQGILKPCIFSEPIEKVLETYADDIKEIRKNGLTIFQAHAPFPAYANGDRRVTDYAIEVTKKCIELCAHVGCGKLVVHGISLAVGDENNDPASIRELNLYLYRSLIPTLQKCDVKVCLENLFTGKDGQVMEGICSVPEEAVEYIDLLNAEAGKEAFGFCLDTGHLNLLGKNQKTFIEKLGKRIIALHVHDNRGTVDNHLMPYTGTISWKETLAGLKNVGYRENLSFETFMQVNVKKGVDPDVVPVFLRAIHDVGVVFAKRIEE